MNGKLFAITSIVVGNGSKYFATNLAHYLKKKDKKDDLKVLLIDFDFDNPYLAYEYVKHDMVHGVDNLLNTINSGGLTDELFLDNIVGTDLDFDVLKGTALPDKKRVFTKEVVRIIIEKALSNYDYVFVVIGNNPSDAGMVYTLTQADEVFIVARDNYTNVSCSTKVFDYIKAYYKKSNPLMIIHNYRNTHATSEFNRLLKDGEIYVAGSLVYDEKSIDNVNLEKDKGIFNKSLNENEFMNIIKQKIDIEPSHGGSKKKKSKKVSSKKVAEAKNISIDEQLSDDLIIGDSKDNLHDLTKEMD